MIFKTNNVEKFRLTRYNMEVSAVVIFSNLPTSNPSVAGQLWNDSGTLKVSAG